LTHHREQDMSGNHEEEPVFVLRSKDEMNLAEFPIARMGRNDKRKTIKYSGRIVDKSGKVQEQIWIASGSDLFGLPTEFAERVLMTLIFITAEAGFASRKVPFTIYRVLQMLGQTDNHRNYKAVINALQQLVGVTIYSDGAFWDKATNARVVTHKGFHLIEEFWVKSLEKNEQIIQEEGVNGYIIWSERIWASFKAGYIKNLDATFYYSLQNPIARRLYRFLDKRMHYQDEYQIDVFDLAGRLGISTYRYPSDITTKMKPGFEELQARSYLDSVEVIKVGKFTRIKFVRRPAFQNPSETPSEAYRDAGLDAMAEDAPEAQEMLLAALYRHYGTSETLRAIWTDILREFEIALPWDSYSLFRDSLLLDIEDAEAVLGVTSTGQEWIEKRIKKQVLSRLSLRLKEQVVAIRFVPLVL
jgi:hypothetical protein